MPVFLANLNALGLGCGCDEPVCDPGAELSSRCYALGAVVYQHRVYQHRAVPWQVPSFDVQRCGARLRELDARVRAEGRFVVNDHRFLIEARAD